MGKDLSKTSEANNLNRSTVLEIPNIREHTKNTKLRLIWHEVEQRATWSQEGRPLEGGGRSAVTRPFCQEIRMLLQNLMTY